MDQLDSFDIIFERAAQRKGGSDALEALLPKPRDAAKKPAALRKVTDAAILAEMTKCVFRSGFVWQIIENKWPGFEAAFDGFDVARCAMLSDEELEGLCANPDIVRNAKKIEAVRRNAQFVLDTRAQHGSFGDFLATWPADDFVGMLGAILGQAPLRLVVESIGWRGMVTGLAIVAFILSLLVFFLIPKRPQREGKSARDSGSLSGLLAVLRKPQSWICAVIGFGLPAIMLGFASLWAVP